MIPNTCIGGEGFYISYNNYDINIYGCDTTALVKGQMERFYILNGDHRAQYQPLIAKGFDACLKYFCDHWHDVNGLSDKLPEENNK